MRRIATALLALLTLLAALPLPAETPRPEDIPKPEPIALGLAGDPRPDVLRYLYVRTADNPSLSPDGSQLAFETEITGQPQLWVVDAAGGWPRQLTFGSEGITGHEWSPRGDWIFYSTDRGGNEREGFYLINPDGTREKELLPPSGLFRTFGGFSPDGSQIAYAATPEGSDTYDIHLLDVETGKDRLVLKGRLGLYVASWSPRGAHVILVETRGEDAVDVHLLDLESGRLETLFKPEEAANHASFVWKPDGSGFYLVTDQGRDFAGLAWYDLGRRELKWIETPDHDVEQVALGGDRYLAWTTNEGGYTVLHARDLAQNKPLGVPKLPPGVYGLYGAERAPVFAILVEGPQVPGDIWTWDARQGEARRATVSSTAGLDPASFVVPEHLDFKASDGVTLHGLLYLPKNLPAGARPPVLLGVHGGPTGQSRPTYDEVFQYLLTRGIAVLDLNFRGSTGYGKTFARLDNQRQRPNAVRDMVDALDFLAKDGRVDASRSAVMGGSYGGYMTFAALTTYPDRFRSGVSFVGVSNWITALQGASPGLKASDRIEYGDIDNPEDRAFFQQLSPIANVSRVKSPVMVIHGANDPRDPVTESDTFVEGVRQNGGTVEYLRFPDEGHGLRKLANRVTAYRRVAAFLERTLSP
ncbi:MAG TPA: S9 family peptidase [Thermoanaerobaculia bacterium]|nr:S9 family peptidase [Thermoanaerobaculia bacterium]